MGRKKTVVNEIHVAKSDAEIEFLNAGDAPEVPETLPPACKKREKDGKLLPVSKLSANQLDQACDAVIMGHSVSEVAQQLGVEPKPLAFRIKERMGMLYQRKWQQSVNFDALRAELILKNALERLQEGPKWGKLALEVLSYRSRVYGFENTTMTEASIRVAGLSQEEIFAEIKKRL